MKTPSRPDEIRPTVFIVDDDAAIREAISRLVRSVDLNAEAFASAKDFLAARRPDVAACLVLDVRLKGPSGLELQRELVASKSHIPIIFITGHGDIPMSVKAMKAGAVEFLPKPFRDQDLLEAIQQAIERDTKAVQQRSELTELRRRYDTLSSREREVMALVVRGELNKQIASDLGTSEITVKTQRGQVMKKMQAKSVPDLVRMSEQL